MVRLTKFMVLVGGVIGIAAFFVPFIVVSGGGQQESFTAISIVQGIDSAEQVVASAEVAPLLSPADRADALDSLRDFKGVLIGVFVPSLVLALFGAIGTLRGRFGRGFGIGSVLFGGAALAVWLGLRMLLERGTTAHVTVTGGVAMHLLLASGLLGLIGGLIATFTPDRGR
jgi:hypothetical protein